MAKVIKLSGALTGNLAFPTISQFGFGLNEVVQSYLARMDAAGMAWTTDQTTAWNTFALEGVNSGWLSKLMAVYPMFGDSVAAARIPFTSPLNTNAILEHPSTDPTSLYHAAANGMYEGVFGFATTSTTTNERVLIDLTVSQQIQKSGAFANGGVNAGGFHFVWNAFADSARLRAGSLGRRDGSTSSFGTNAISGGAGTLSLMTLNDGANRSTPASYDESSDRVLLVSQNVPTQTDGDKKILAGSPTNLVAATGTTLGPITPDVDTLATKFGVNCRAQALGSPAVYDRLDPAVRVKWVGLDDGSMTAAMQLSMATAILELKASLYA